MKLRLYLIRHAKASARDYFPGDCYRTLEKEGYDEASVMADRFIGAGNKPELYISSPAVRAFSTCLLFSERMSYPVRKIRISQSVYNATPEKLLRVLKETESNSKSVVLFGHNPGLTELTNILCGPVLFNLPTAGIVTIDLEAEAWSEVKPGDGKMATLMEP